jgi:hypothetical protein
MGLIAKCLRVKTYKDSDSFEFEVFPDNCKV